MSNIKDVATVVISRGEPIGKAGEMAGLFLQYRMDEIVARYNGILDEFFDCYSNQDNPFRLKYEKKLPDGGGPSKYLLRGSLKFIGMNQMWQTLLGEIMLALEYASPFLTGAKINPYDSTEIRAPWFQTHPEHGAMLNTKKHVEIHRVGKSARLGNGQGPMLDALAKFFDEEGPLVADTQIDEIWAIGEPTAARKLASAIRQKCLQHGGKLTNDDLLRHVYACTSYKAVALIKCIEGDHRPWFVGYEGSFIPDERDAVFIKTYHAQRQRWFLSPTDPFSVNVENGVDPLRYAAGHHFERYCSRTSTIDPVKE